MPIRILVPEFHAWWVAASFLVSALGAYIALVSMVPPRHSAHRRVSGSNTALAGIALGGMGLWSMHVLGMLALDVPVHVGYGPVETVASLLAAVAVSTLALRYIAAQPFTIERLLVAGPLAGLGAVLMHYLGVYGMRFGGTFVWSNPRVALSIAIAIVAATAALGLAFHSPKRPRRKSAALLMAAAVCAMHYTGMAAATLACTADSPGADLRILLRGDVLLGAVLVISLGVLAMIGLKRLQRRLVREGWRDLW